MSSPPFEIFKNALVYSVCAQIVNTVVQTSDDANSLIVLIVVFAFIINGLMKFKTYTDFHQRTFLAATSVPRAYHEVVKLLLQNKADVHQATQGGFFPLYATSENGHIEVVKLLLSFHIRHGWVWFI